MSYAHLLPTIRRLTGKHYPELEKCVERAIHAQDRLLLEDLTRFLREIEYKITDLEKRRFHPYRFCWG